MFVSYYQKRTFKRAKIAKNQLLPFYDQHITFVNGEPGLARLLLCKGAFTVNCVYFSGEFNLHRQLLKVCLVADNHIFVAGIAHERNQRATAGRNVTDGIRQVLPGQAGAVQVVVGA